MNDGGGEDVDGGALIVFEGLDGSGKSTQLPWLAETLRGAGHDVVETREPYDCPAGRLGTSVWISSADRKYSATRLCWSIGIGGYAMTP